MRAQNLKIGRRYVLKRHGRPDEIVTAVEGSTSAHHVLVQVPVHVASKGTLYAQISNGVVSAYGHLEELEELDATAAPGDAPPAPVPFSDPGDLERFRRYFAAPGFSFSSFA